MIDKEKVLHGLDSCGFHDGIPNICEVTECPYRDNKAYCVHELAHDAGMLISELLKAQEPVEPKQYEGTSYCGNCGDPINKLDNYCHECGRAVKWDG